MRRSSSRAETGTYPGSHLQNHFCCSRASQELRGLHHWETSRTTRTLKRWMCIKMSNLEERLGCDQEANDACGWAPVCRRQNVPPWSTINWLTGTSACAGPASRKKNVLLFPGKMLNVDLLNRLITFKLHIKESNKVVHTRMKNAVKRVNGSHPVRSMTLRGPMPLIQLSWISWKRRRWKVGVMEYWWERRLLTTSVWSPHVSSNMDEALLALTLTSHNASVMLCQLRHDEVMIDRRQELVCLFLQRRWRWWWWRQ